MRTTPAVLRLALCLSSLTPIVSAWPGWLPEKDALFVRQDDESENTSEEATRTTETSAEETTAADDNSDGEETASATEDASSTETGTRTGTSTRETTSISIDPAGYPGGIKMITPNPTQVATALYKIGDNIELAWNYTSVQVKPSAVDILVSCSVASETWTLTANMTYETEVNFIWETEDDADDVDKPLLTEMYTLIVKDVDAEISDRPEAGHLGSNMGFTFGLYRPAAYTPLSDWECTTCNAGSGGFDSQAAKLAVTMAFVTVCSFTWFVTGLGLQ